MRLAVLGTGRMGAQRAALLARHNDVEAVVLAGYARAPDELAGAARLRREGAGAVVISRGPDGLFAVTEEGAWQAAPPERLRGNPTGAGDAAGAALVAGIVDGTPWPQRLTDAVALSAAAVRSPSAGSFDPDAYRRYRGEVVTEMLADTGDRPGAASA